MKRKLTKAQRRVLAGYLRTQRETLASDPLDDAPPYGRRGYSYWGIVAKLVRRGYISEHQLVQAGGWWILMCLVTAKGRAALGEA
jgi:hypothetical protein